MTEYRLVPLSELTARQQRFRNQMDVLKPDWRLAVVFSKINLYYFTGTMQEGMLLIPRDEPAVFWVRRSYERALEESHFPLIKPMDSFRDASDFFIPESEAVHIESEIVPVAFLQRFLKYFPFPRAESMDQVIASVRAVKSPYELELMTGAGRIHQRVLENLVPEILREGMSEFELATELFSLLLKEGHHGVARLGMFDTEIALGHICFGESSIYPTYFNGPGGNYGLSPAVPLFGSPRRFLSKGDLVFIDVVCGVEGYHTDKTMTYMYGRPLSQEAMDTHKRCVEIQNEIAGLLVPGAVPSAIYREITEGQSPDFLENFMGYGNRKVKFLGHGIGLWIDETPIIAQGFDNPIEEGMVFALEPKKGIAGVGMVGIENTFAVTPQGGKSLTGFSPGLIPVY